MLDEYDSDTMLDEYDSDTMVLSLGHDSNTMLDEHDSDTMVLSLGHNSDTMLDEHDSLQWYDIVHFEHKLSWLFFRLAQKASTNRECILWL